MSDNEEKQKAILVTGGLGYIGSHICVELLDDDSFRDHVVVVVDNCSNVKHPHKVIASILQSCKSKTSQNRLIVVEAEICDIKQSHFKSLEWPPTCVVHCAGLKAVGESVSKPEEYYRVNVGGTATLLSWLGKTPSCFIFSSSATVYGNPTALPITEDHPIAPLSPYGDTKAAAEKLLSQWQLAKKDERRVLLLRYMNPVGAHDSGLLGEDPFGVPQNLMPFVAQVAAGQRPCVSVFGDDYDTPDGTGVRDYVHVVDLAKAHVEAAKKMLFNDCTSAASDSGGWCKTLNFGRGKGISVLEMIKAFEKASNKKIEYQIAARREGDAAEVYCSNARAQEFLPESTQKMKSVDEMCSSAWKSISN